MRKIIAFLTVLFGHLAVAFAGHDIGTSTGTLFTKPTTFLQDAVNFLDGPAATAYICIALVVALAAWNFAPENSRWVGKSVRAVVSGILVFAVTVAVNYMRSI